MKRRDNSGVNWTMVIAGGIVVVAAVAVAAQVVPELAPVRRYTQDAEEFATHLPSRLQDLLDDARGRIARARAAFRSARLESERALTVQFQEAKQRGSVPPI